jgi:hypothetical protein
MSVTEQAVPGTVIPSGSLVSPGGGQGPQGITAVSADAGNLAVLGSDNLVSVPTSNITPVIWSQRLRSFNAVGNPNFEVDQRNVGTSVTIPGGNNFTFACDRWSHVKTTPTMAYTAGSGAAGSNPVSVPGTSFCITRSQLNITTTVQQTTLAVGDLSMVSQSIEGPAFRELLSDVSSVSILATTNVAGGLKFALSLRDPGSTTKSLCKLCTLTSSGVWQLITLPNLPVFPSGNFSVLSGNAGCLLGICFSAGSTYIPPANDTWQNGNFTGAIGMDNLGSKPVGSYLILGFIQHEPGTQCSTLIDCPFGQNLDGDMGCLRYFQKSCSYGSALSNNGVPGYLSVYTAASQVAIGSFPFKKTMAKTPTMTGWSTNGNINVVRDAYSSLDRAVTGPVTVSDAGFGGFNISTTNAALTYYQFHYSADTGW